MRTLRITLAGWLAWFAAWLRPAEPPPPPDPKTLRAQALVADYDALVDVSGEYKRHQVYARLRKEFPEAEGRDLGLLIELAVQAHARVR